MDKLFCDEFYDQCISLYEQLYDLWTSKNRIVENIQEVVYISLSECVENLQDERNAPLIQKLAGEDLGRSAEKDGNTLIQLRDVSVVLNCNMMSISIDPLFESAELFDELHEKISERRDAQYASQLGTLQLEATENVSQTQIDSLQLQLKALQSEQIDAQNQAKATQQ